MKTETAFDHRGEPILGENQNPVHLIDPEKTYSVDEQGNFIKRKKPNDSMIISHYWATKQKTLAIVLFLSGGILFAILVQESNFFNVFFEELGKNFGELMGSYAELF